MAVIVELPDEQMSMLAKRLIGRRSGVHVVVAGESNGARERVLAGSEPPRKILIRDYERLTALEMLDLLHNDVWAVLPADSAEVDARLRDTVDTVRAGSSPLLTELAGDRHEVGPFLAALRSRASERRVRSGSSADSPLSEREMQILRRISQGVTSAEIAAEMGFQLQTVKNKVTTILTKTQARSRTHAVAIALDKGWIRGG